MCDQDHFDDDLQKYLNRGAVTRRQFAMLTAGMGLMIMLPRSADALDVSEKDVAITTPDGVADAYFVFPSTGAHAAVLVWPDILGLRPAFRQMGKRMAESGYAVLVVNPFLSPEARTGGARGRSFHRRGDTQYRGASHASIQCNDARHRRARIHRVARQPATSG